MHEIIDLQINIHYSLHDLAISDDKQRATCRVKVPSDLLPEYDAPLGGDPLAVLVLRNVNNTRCLSMMRDCIHRNILHALLIADRGDYVEVWVEDFTGILEDYLQSAISVPYSMGASICGPKVMLPVDEIRISVRYLL